jgi:hypothetical protein
MPVGPGKYDDVATTARELTGARAVVVIVLGGNKGSGFSVQAELGARDSVAPENMARLLRAVADEIEAEASCASAWKRA